MKKEYYLIGIAGLLILGVAIIGLQKSPNTQTPTGSETENSITNSPSTGTQSPTTKPTSPATSPIVSKNSGRVVFAIKDAAVPIETIKSVFVTITEITAHSQKGWVTVSKTPQQYDLLKLYKTSSTELFADTRLEAGTYDQIRLMISKITVTNIYNESKDAKLPSKELKLNTQLVIAKNDTSSTVLDFQFNKSLHTTGDGQYIFAPVISLETKSGVTIQTLANNRIDVIGGTSKFSANTGMNEEGAFKIGFSFDPYTEFKIVSGAIKVSTAEEKTFAVSAETALTNAIQSGKIDTAYSIKTFTRNNQVVWRILGKKGTLLIIVYINPTTGSVIATE